MDKIEEIRLRQISSMDHSKTFSSMDEKREALKGKKTQISIPTYEKTPPYKTSVAKRFLARVRYFSAILRQKIRGKDYPLIAVLVVNNKCNWDCVYCFGDYPNRREVDYTTDEIKYVIDELYRMGARYINMHGGETLLRNDIGELVHYAKHKGMYVCVITNGSLLANKIDEVKAVDNLTISLDGGAEGNDRNRGEGTYEASLAAIRLAVKSGIPLRVQATLTRHTMNDIGTLARLAQEEGFHLQFSILFKPLKRAQDCQMSPEEIRRTVQEIRKYKAMGYPIFTSDRVLDASYHWPFDYNESHHVTENQIPDTYRPYHIPCFYSRTKFTIEADGYIYPCFLTTDGSFKPLNWKEVGVEKAIAHVQQRNTCKACPAMTQNDHNALLGLNIRQVGYLVKDQLKETLGIKNRVKPS